MAPVCFRLGALLVSSSHTRTRGEALSAIGRDDQAGCGWRPRITECSRLMADADGPNTFAVISRVAIRQRPRKYASSSSARFPDFQRHPASCCGASRLSSLDKRSSRAWPLPDPGRRSPGRVDRSAATDPLITRPRPDGGIEIRRRHARRDLWLAALRRSRRAFISGISCVRAHAAAHAGLVRLAAERPPLLAGLPLAAPGSGRASWRPRRWIHPGRA